MLEGMRKAAQNRFGKFVMTIVMGLIIVSFAVWGVGDMLRGFTSTSVAKVGSQTISAQDYSTELQNELYRLQRQTRQPITPAQARAFGLDAQVLSRMVDEAALDARARTMGLSVSDAAIAEATRNDPQLKGANGQFDRARFEQALRDSGLSERGYVARQREFYVRQQLQYALIDGMTAPKPLAEALAAARDQTRDISYFTLGAAAAGDIPPPSDETLRSYFDAHKSAWRAPERRSFDELVVTPTVLAKPDDVSDEDAKALYEKDKAKLYTTPEKRNLQQIVFPNEAEAKDAKAKIDAGTSFDDIAKARGLGPADLDLGETTKEGAFDPALADAAFALPQGGVSAPVKSAFGYALVRVVSITPGSTKWFGDVEPEIRKRIATSRAAESVQSLHDKIEDAKASGKSVAEAAKSVGLETRTYTGIARDGTNAEGADAGVVEKDLVLPAVFASDVGVDDEAISTKDHGYVWFSVAKIDPAHEVSFEDVKSKVEAAWRQEEIGKRLADKAAELAHKIEAGADIKDVAAGEKADLKEAKGVKRAGGEGLAPSVAAAVFAVGPNGAGSAGTPDGRVVFKVTGDTIPPVVAEDPGVKMDAERLKGAWAQSMLEQYVEALKREIGVSVDRRAMLAAEGG